MNESNTYDNADAKILEVPKARLLKTLKSIGANKTLDSIVFIERYDVRGFAVSNIAPTEESLAAKLKQIIEGIHLTKDITLTLQYDTDSLELFLTPTTTKADHEMVVSFTPDERTELSDWLIRCGLKRTGHQEVKRMKFTYRPLDVTFVIEEWPSIPPYVKIIGKGNKTILQAAALIGYTENDLHIIGRKELFKRYSASPIYMSFADAETDITHDDLAELVHKAIKNHAPHLTDSEVALIANHYIFAEYNGKKTHGLRKLCWDVQFYEDRLGKPFLSKDSPSMALMDGQREIGPLAVAQGVEIAIKKAKETGIAIVGITGAQRFGVLATWTEMIAKAGLIGVLTTSTEPFTALSETATGVVGTNPLSISIPFKDTPIVYDAAFSKAPISMMWLYRLLGLNLPSETFLGEGGQYTNDPFRSKYVDVFGGPKGSGLAIMLQILSGPLMGIESHKSLKNSYENAFYLQAIDPSFFQPIEKFEAQVDGFIQFAKKAPLREGHNGLHLPGEKSKYNLDKTIKKGKIQVHTGVVDWLAFLGSN